MSAAGAGSAVPPPPVPKRLASDGSGSMEDPVEVSDEDRRVTEATSEKKLKILCRTGLHNADRAAVWMRLAGATDREDFYDAALQRVFGAGNANPSKVYRVPFLGVEPMALPPSATELMHQPSISLSAAHDRVVCVLAQLHGLRYCPMLSNLGLLLLRHLSEPQTFAVLEALLKDNREEWFQKTWEDEVAFVNTFQDILESRYSKLATHLESLGGGTFSFYGSWFRSFFVGWLPSEDTFKIVDCYLSEGPKVLIRFGIGFLKLCLKELQKCTSDNEVEDALRDYVSMRGFAGKYSFEALSTTSFAVRNLSRKTIYTLYEKHRSMIGDLADDEEDMMATAYRHPSVWYNPKLLGPRSLLLERTFRMVSREFARERIAEGLDAKDGDSDEGFGSEEDDWTPDTKSKKKKKKKKKKGGLDSDSDTDSIKVPEVTLKDLSVASSPQLSALMSWLPDSVSLCNWTLVYASHVHGFGLHNLHSRVKAVGPTLFVVQTQVRSESAAGAEVTALGPSASPVFGFFSSRSMKARKSPKWVGGLDNFMFQLLPDLTVTGVTTAATAVSLSASRIRKDRAADLRSNYSGTVLRADSFLLSTPKYLAFGGNPVTTEVAFKLGEDMESCEMSADLLRDLGVWSLLRAGGAGGTAAGDGEDGAAAGAGAGAGAGGASSSSSKKSSKKDADPTPVIPAPERQVHLDVINVEVFAFSDRNGNFLQDDGASAAPRSEGTPGRDKDGWF